jgi:chaperonin cofactor prefoldin
VTTGFASLNEYMSNLNDKVDALVVDVEMMKTTQAKREQRMQRMQEEIDALKLALLSTQI